LSPTARWSHRPNIPGIRHKHSHYHLN
jgi:hypothetical protein